jgi:Protein of unknown function (DUF4244)
MRRLNDEGTTTVEYAIATIAAAGFAGLLIALITSDELQGWLADLIEKAMTMT